MAELIRRLYIMLPGQCQHKKRGEKYPPSQFLPYASNALGCLELTPELILTLSAAARPPSKDFPSLLFGPALMPFILTPERANSLLRIAFCVVTISRPLLCAEVPLSFSTIICRIRWFSREAIPTMKEFLCRLLSFFLAALYSRFIAFLRRSIR